MQFCCKKSKKKTLSKIQDKEHIFLIRKNKTKSKSNLIK